MAASQAPEKTFRIGLVSASVFKNTFDAKSGGKRTLRTVVLQRAYMNEQEKWEHTNSFGIAEIAQAQRVLALAQQFVEGMEADTTA